MSSTLIGAAADDMFLFTNAKRPPIESRTVWGIALSPPGGEGTPSSHGLSAPRHVFADTDRGYGRIGPQWVPYRRPPCIYGFETTARFLQLAIISSKRASRAGKGSEEPT